MRGKDAEVLTEDMELKTKRVYEDPAPEDGYRVLVDRLWPRGVSKERAKLDLWAKGVAPSAELRTEFHHEGMTWDAFETAYRAELAGPNKAALDDLRGTIQQHPVATLLFGSRDVQHNEAVILRDLLLQPSQ